MMLKFWAFIYRSTGYYSDYARRKEKEFIEENRSKIIKRFSEIDGYDLSVGALISIERGCWQAKHGFITTFKQMKRKSKKRLKKLEKYKK